MTTVSEYANSGADLAVVANFHAIEGVEYCKMPDKNIIPNVEFAPVGYIYCIAQKGVFHPCVHNRPLAEH